MICFFCSFTRHPFVSSLSCTYSKDVILTLFNSTADMFLYLVFTLETPNKIKIEKRWQFFKERFKSWETTVDFLPYSHFDEPLESLGESQMKSGASCTLWCFVSNRAAFVQLSGKERFTVCRSVFSNHKHTACVHLFNFIFYRGYVDS